VLLILFCSMDFQAFFLIITTKSILPSQRIIVSLYSYALDRGGNIAPNRGECYIIYDVTCMYDMRVNALCS
jgi:hypothetical protein